MLVDAFTFTNEFDLLDVRLSELSGVVDRFVVVEAAETFAGEPKPLHFQERARDYAHWPITHVVARLPATHNPWLREAAQRNAILAGLDGAGVPDDARVLIGDADEIARPSAIPATVAPGQCYVFAQAFYYYEPTLRVKGVWRGTRLVTAGTARAWTPQTVRSAGGTLVPDGGWHFSYFGGIAAIQAKLQAFSHQEYNRPEFTDRGMIEARVAQARDLFDRDVMELERVPIDGTYPRAMQEWAYAA